MKRIIPMAAALMLLLGIGDSARAQQIPFAMTSSNCLNSPQQGNAQWCFDSGTHELYYWNGSAFVASPGGNFDPTAPGPIGGTTPAAGHFTTLSATGAATLSSTLAAGATSVTGALTTTTSVTATTKVVGTLGVGAVPAALSTFGTCDAGHEGLNATQTNSTAACSAGATATSSGTTHCQIYCNGTNWLQTGL